MRILITALALTFALPAAAQTAPAQPAQPHQSGSHGQHGGDHRQHNGGQHHGQHQGQHQGGQHQGGQHHGGQGQGCCADRNGNGRPDCCDAMAGGDHSGHGAPSAQRPQAHQGH